MTSGDHGGAVTLRGVDARPGALELLERGDLTETELWASIADGPGRIRGSADAVGDRSRWRALLDRLRGYRRDDVLVDDETMWLPLVELLPPASDVRATCSFTRSDESRTSLQLDVLGSGFGSSLRASLSTEIAFDAIGTPVALCAPIRIRAVRYVHDRLPPLIRVDVVGEEQRLRLQQSEPGTATVPVDSPGHQVVERVDLSGVRSSGVFTWKRRAERSAEWSCSLGVDFPQIARSKIGVSLGGTDRLEVGFDLPYGRDYVVYLDLERAPVLPRCGLAPAA